MGKFEWKNGSKVEPAKVEINGVVYEVTDAQYEGETPLSASNLNAMQDGIYEDITNLESKANDEFAKIENYSTEEQRIGTWLGKPLYRKVITGTVDKSATSAQIETGITDYDRYWIAEGYVYPTSGTGVTIPLNCVWTTGAYIHTRMINGAKIDMQFANWEGTYYIVVHFTKTTS
jgi:hypothetical protein